MDLADFRMFVAVAERASYTKAARDLGLTQPAISQRMKHLETELGARLVSTAGRVLRLTDAGEALLVEARKVLRAADAAREAVDSVKGLVRGHVALGASTTPGIYLLPELLGRFRTGHPDIRITLRIGNTLAIEEMILAGELDLGVVGGHLASRDLEEDPLLDDRLTVFSATSHPLAGSGQVGVKEVLAFPFVMREKGSATRDAFERFLAKKGLDVDVSLEIGNPEALKRAVQSGAGLGVMSEIALVQDVECERLVLVKVRGFDVTRRFRLVTRRGREPGRAAKAALDAIRGAKAEGA
jgi:DNA-binding transcriptional LysR family regulator